MNRPRFDTYSKAVLTVIAVCLVWLSAGCTQIVPHDVVKVKRLVLVDEKGRDRVVLEAGKSGPRFRFLDEDGQSHFQVEGVVGVDETGQVHFGLLKEWKDPVAGPTPLTP